MLVSTHRNLTGIDLGLKNFENIAVDNKNQKDLTRDKIALYTTLTNDTADRIPLVSSSVDENVLQYAQNQSRENNFVGTQLETNDASLKVSTVNNTSSVELEQQPTPAQSAFNKFPGPPVPEDFGSDRMSAGQHLEAPEHPGFYDSTSPRNPSNVVPVVDDVTFNGVDQRKQTNDSANTFQVPLHVSNESGHQVDLSIPAVQPLVY